MRKQKHREGERLRQSHTANKSGSEPGEGPALWLRAQILTHSSQEEGVEKALALTRRMQERDFKILFAFLLPPPLNPEPYVFALEKHLRESKELQAPHANSCQLPFSLSSPSHTLPAPHTCSPSPPQVQLEELTVAASHPAIRMAEAAQSTSLHPACVSIVPHRAHTLMPVFQADPEDKG